MGCAPGLQLRQVFSSPVRGGGSWRGQQFGCVVVRQDEATVLERHPQSVLFERDFEEKYS
ncbi:hypothetical protein BKH04_01555 [Actinomyces naeslundii]|nr:hypothetical protein BKH04_01555 [Actinomyces naeslundii]